MMMSSVAKHCRNVDTILQMAGPRSRNNRRGQGLIGEPPFFDAPRVDQEPPSGDWTIEEVRAMYLAADGMTVPTIDGVDPVDWWRTLICLAYYTGLRCSALMSVEYSMVDNEWINVPARLSKRRKGKRQYLHHEAIEHIDRIRTERAIILEWPRWATTKRTAYSRFRQLQNAAGISKSRRWAFQSFRKTHLTMLAGLSLEHEQGLAVAQKSAGHSNRAVTVGHYVSGDVQDRMVAAAIDMMPSPVPPHVVAEREFID
jgi:integrase